MSNKLYSVNQVDPTKGLHFYTLLLAPKLSFSMFHLSIDIV